jgi:2-hydroxy-6-oxonona-2,4-dienedioate hydrolase
MSRVTVRWVQVAGRRARYREAGRGAPLVLVHGLGLSSRFWHQSYGPLAAAGYRVLAPDLPGFGATPGPATGLSVRQTAEWLLAFADRAGGGRAAWLGQSIAAQAVVELAARRPEAAAALVLASPTGAPHRLRVARQAAALARDAVKEPWQLITTVAREYAGLSPAAYIGTWVKAQRHQPLARAARVRCPALIVVGRADPVVPDAFVAALERALPRGRTAVVDDAAHGVVYDRPDALHRAVLPFLAEVREQGW